jgi:hypothetical protein
MFFSYGARVMDEETLQLRRLKKNNTYYGTKEQKT